MLESSRKLYAAITEAIGTFGQQNWEQAELLNRVKHDAYNDYFGAYDLPCVTLVHHLRIAGLPELAERAIDGEFDATEAEADEWAQSPEGRETFKRLMEGL